jgi:hypothetical protein
VHVLYDLHCKCTTHSRGVASVQVHNVHVVGGMRSGTAHDIMAQRG